MPRRKNVCLFLAMLAALVLVGGRGEAQSKPKTMPRAGVLRQTPAASPGYLLIHPIYRGETFLIDLDGQPVHSWRSEYASATVAYLLDDGSLLAPTLLVPPDESVQGRGKAGRLERRSWDGGLLWDYRIDNERYVSHHDVEPLPNGNVLITAWDKRSADEAIANGRNPELIREDAVWGETILEVEPDGPTGGKIVWQWNAWDHLIQDFDPKQANYGDPAEHPELINFNFTGRTGGPAGDWIHLNSIDYNTHLDQILVSTPAFHEVWIIDHSTTTEEAAGHAGGRTGKGGDLLYRWGNPKAWMGPSAPAQRLFFQHSPYWIPDEFVGGGRILLYNNGIKGVQRNYSTVDEFTPPLLPNGTYDRVDGENFGPQSLRWRYGKNSGVYRFFADRVSGAQRLPNGNTLICVGSLSRVAEVTRNGQTVWDYFNGSNAGLPVGPKAPYRSAISFEDGGPIGGGGPMFRAERYPPDHPAFAGRTLTPIAVSRDEHSDPAE